jgi:hypothetical protein
VIDSTNDIKIVSREKLEFRFCPTSCATCIFSEDLYDQTYDFVGVRCCLINEELRTLNGDFLDGCPFLAGDGKIIISRNTP